MIEDEIKRRLEYNPETGDIIWKKIEENNQHDKMYNTTRAGQVAGCKTEEGYIRIKVKGKSYRAHKIAWFLYYNGWPSQIIDHQDQDKSNNRIQNLRDCSFSDNSRNQKIRNTNKSGTTGVHFCRTSNKWVAQIYDGSRVPKHLGRFSNLEDAIQVRKNKEKELNYHENHGKLLDSDTQAGLK